MIQRLVNKLGSDIGLENEFSIGTMTRHGRTWGLNGKIPVVKVSMQRGWYKVLSTMTAQGEITYSIKDDNVNGERYIEFLEELISNREPPLILLVDHARFHVSKDVITFVRAHRDNRGKLRIFFLPKRAPEFNQDEHVCNEIINNHIGKQPVRNKDDLKERLVSALD